MSAVVPAGMEAALLESALSGPARTEVIAAESLDEFLSA